MTRERPNREHALVGENPTTYYHPYGGYYVRECAWNVRE